MTDYPLIYRKKHIAYKREPIILEEIMCFLDSDTKNHFLITKFKNNTSYNVTSITIQLTQLNHFNQSIIRSEYTISNTQFTAFKSVVPLERFLVDEACTSVEVKLLKASAVGRYYEEGKWHNTTEVKTSAVSKLETHIIKPERLKFPIHISFYMTVVYALVLVMVYFALRSFS